jgi:hypothetical protein
MPPLLSLSLSLSPSSCNHHWFAYRSACGTVSVLLCVQSAHQTWRGGTIGWVTVWLETPTVTSSMRSMISDALCHAVAPYYKWLWMNARERGDVLGPEWKEDGPFHWYSYQWTTCLTTSTGYALPC